MGMEVAWVFLLMHCFAHSYPFSSSTESGPFDPVLEWDELENEIASETDQEFAFKSDPIRVFKEATPVPETVVTTPRPLARKVPVYHRVPASKVQMELFKPGKGPQPLPESVREMLVVTATPAPAKTPMQKPLMHISCRLDRVYVAVQVALFKKSSSVRFLKLGKCPVNQASKTYYLFMYPLDTAKCGFNLQSNADNFVLQTNLTYQPSTIVREVPLPFTIPVACRYHRFYNSYSTGFYPTLQGGTVFKALSGSTGASLIAQDESGNEMAGDQPYTFGKPMCFELSLKDQPTDQRLYINTCAVTASPNPNSTPSYIVLSKQGCMMDGKTSDQSKFVKSDSTSQKFCIGAFVFGQAPPSSAQQNVRKLYMHCEIFPGNPTPTESAKACNYDTKSKSWSELSGADAVCSCCDSSCPSAQPKSLTVVSSQPWAVDYRQKGDVEPEPQFKASGTEDYADFPWEQDDD